MYEGHCENVDHATAEATRENHWPTPYLRMLRDQESQSRCENAACLRQPSQTGLAASADLIVASDILSDADVEIEGLVEERRMLRDALSEWISRQSLIDSGDTGEGPAL